MSVDLTVLLVTKRREQQCLRCLESLARAAAQALFVHVRVIVGINGDCASPGFEEKMRTWPTLNADVIRFERSLTPAEARNQLISLSQTVWLYFIDDDASVPPDLFERFCEVQEKYSEVVAIGGPNLNPPESTPFQKASGLVLSSRFATYFSSTRYKAVGSTRPCGEESLILCNLFMKREALIKNGFLSELICAEENWLLLDLQDSENSFLYDPRLIVWHERRPCVWSFIGQIYKYGFGRGQIIKRRPAYIKPIHFVPLFCLLYALVILGACIKEGWPLILLLVPLSIYFFFCFAFLIRSKFFNREPMQLAVTGSCMFPMVHASYAVGLLMGLIKG